MKITSKGFIVPAVLALVAVLAIGGGIYAYNRTKVSSGPSQSDSQASATSTFALGTGTSSGSQGKPQTSAPSKDTVIKGNAGQQVALQGEYTCMPHRDKKGPQTLECALGLKADNGSYYALDLSAIAKDAAFMASLPEGTKIKIYGTFVPLDKLDAGTTERYDIKGLIEVSGASNV